MVPAFITLGLACLRLAKQTGRAALELDDYANELLFRVTGKEISICSTMWGRTATLDYESLFDYWLSFAKDARRVITQRNPEKQSNAYWNLLQDDFIIRLEDQGQQFTSVGVVFRNQNSAFWQIHNEEPFRFGRTVRWSRLFQRSKKPRPPILSLFRRNIIEQPW